MYRIFGGVLGAWLLSASFQFGFANSLECDDFKKIVGFVHQEHLRFQAESFVKVPQLIEEALDKVPEVLRSDGAFILATLFEKHYRGRFAKISQLQLEDFCFRLQHTRYREAFLKAYVASLDPFSEFYPAAELKTKTSVIDGHFVGVGIGTKIQDSFVEVTEVISGGPADRILEVGDRMTKIDSKTVRQMTQNDLRQRIRGPRHSSVEFEVVRGDQTLHLQVKRDYVYQKSLTHEWLDEKILKIKIHRFYVQTAMEIQQLIERNRSRIQGIIFDLRDNPGGLLQAARDVVDLFIEQGVVVHLRGQYDDQMLALGTKDYLDIPLVILINERSASASEIMAGALRDYGRALLVGSKTFGKSCVQNIYETDQAIGTRYRAGLKITTLWFYLPSGSSVQNLIPDIEIASKQESPSKGSQMPFDWPQKIEVIPAHQQDRSFRNRFKAIKDHLAGFSESEELGKALLRQLAELSVE
jgi:carboxyl-terminal processing protease